MIAMFPFLLLDVQLASCLFLHALQECDRRPFMSLFVYDMIMRPRICKYAMTLTKARGRPKQTSQKL
jgi:hypothetical protein